MKKKTITYCDFTLCKLNNYGTCLDEEDDPALCPKNNDTSVFENPELLKDLNLREFGE